MSPFPAAIARARSEFGAGSGFVVAVKPPCTIGKTSELVMFVCLAKTGPRKGVSKSLLITKVLSLVGEFLDETGSVTPKPCSADKKHKRHKTLIKRALCLLSCMSARVRLTVGLEPASWFDSDHG